jgi:hypothetical protein
VTLEEALQQVEDDIRRRGPLPENIKASIRETAVRRWENEVRRKLSLELIDAGFKALAIKYHPDRGGTSVDMARLSTIRDALKLQFPPPRPRRPVKQRETP